MLVVVFFYLACAMAPGASEDSSFELGVCVYEARESLREPEGSRASERTNERMNKFSFVTRSRASKSGQHLEINMRTFNRRF